MSLGMSQAVAYYQGERQKCFEAGADAMLGALIGELCRKDVAEMVAFITALRVDIEMMAKSWRPEGWFNEYEDAILEPDMSAIKAACVELGADRILEALRKKSDELLYILMDLEGMDISVETAHNRICSMLWGEEGQND